MRVTFFFLSLFFISSIYSQELSLHSVDSLTIAVNALIDEEDYDKANTLLQQISTYYLTQKQYNEYAATELKIAIHYQYEDKYEEADSILSTIINLHADIENRATLGSIYHKRGVSRYYLNQYNDAIVDYQKAIEIRQKILNKNDLAIVKGYRNIGHVYRDLKDHDNAKKYYQKALDLHLTNERLDSLLLVSNYTYLGETLTDLEDFEMANTYLFLALEYAKTVHKDEPWEIAKIYAESLSLLHKRTGNNETLIKSLKKALMIYQGIDDKFDEDWWNIATCNNNLGVAYDLVDNLDQSISFYEKAIKINTQFPNERIVYLADNFSNLSVVYEQLENYSKAIDYIDRAFLIYQKIGDASSIANVFENKGVIFTKQKEHKKAIQSYQDAINAIVQDEHLADWHQQPNPQHTIVGSLPNLANILSKKAEAAYSLYQQTKEKEFLVLASSTYESFNQLINATRQNFKADESKQFLSSKAKLSYEKAIQVALELYQLEKKATYLDQAFQYAEHSKAITLLDAVKRNRANSSAGIPSAILSQQQYLQTRIAQLEQNLQTSKSSDQQQAYREQIITQQRRLELLQDSLAANFPLYHSIKNDTTSLRIADCQSQLLNENEAILHYTVGEEQMYIFIITKKEVDIQSVDLVDLEYSIRQFRAGIYVPFNGKSWTKAQQDSLAQLYTQQAHFLYQKLITPIEEAITSASKLYIIPDGVLGYLPFEALLTMPIEKDYSDFSTLPYFGKKQAISYSYSAQLLKEMMVQNPSNQQEKILAFAPVFKSSDLAPLLYNQKEVEAIAELYPTTTAIANEATRADFLGQARDYSILHLSSHARTNDSLPDLSYIAFSQFSSTTETEELLYVYDLYTLPLQADMIVLSACETGIGKLQKGEGIMSLARGFSYAGAKSIITTLWRVNDQKTTQIILDFYQNLDKKQSKDQALWTAKQQMIKEGLYAHPYYWAGFIGIGNMTPIDLKASSSFLWLLLLIPLAILLGIFFKKRFFATDY